LGCCLKKSEDAANMRRQAIIQGQSRCMADFGTFATYQCTGAVTPLSANNIGVPEIGAYYRRYCTARPRPHAHESDDSFQVRYTLWLAECQRSIATGLTADNRSRCKDDLQRGHGDFWDKLVINAGPLGSWGWDVGTNKDQGFEAACTQQVNLRLLESNKKKVDADISCHEKYGH